MVEVSVDLAEALVTVAVSVAVAVEEVMVLDSVAMADLVAVVLVEERVVDLAVASPQTETQQSKDRDHLLDTLYSHTTTSTDLLSWTPYCNPAFQAHQH